MALPRRFYNVLVLSLIVTLSAYLFLYRSSGPSYASPIVDINSGNPSLNFNPSEDTLKDTIAPVKDSSYLDKPSKSPLPPPATTKPEGNKQEVEEQAVQETIRIAVTESGGSHDEVTAALIHAFGKQPGAEISTFLLLQRYGITDIIQGFNLTSPIAISKPSGAFEASLTDLPHPHILVAATCEIEIIKLAAAYEALLAGGKTFLFCIIHHADRWVEGELVDAIRPWVEQSLVHFIGLSAHTAEYLRTKCITKWSPKTTILIDALPPVFPVKIEEPPKSNGTLTFALQGDYDPSRRNYTSTFTHLNSVVTFAQNLSTPHNITLRLIGHGTKPEVPEALKSHISFDHDLDYQTYYTLLSQTFTLLPSFASKEYYDRKASSTVPAALIAGAPLVANADLLEAYTYVPASAVWIQGYMEGEMDVVQRIVGMSDDERDAKKKIVRETRRVLVEKNVKVVGRWMKNGLARVK